MIGPDGSAMSGGNGDQADAAARFMREKLGSEVDEAAGAAGRAAYLPTDASKRKEDPRASLTVVVLPGKKERVPSDFAADLGKVLANAPIYRREDIIVTVEPDGMLKMMTADRLVTWVDDYATISETYLDGEGEDAKWRFRKKAMLPALAKVVLQSDAFSSRIRQLSSVHQVRMPVMRRNGRVELLPLGYDVESRIYTLGSDVAIDEKMILARAVEVLNAYYGGFPWADLDVETGKSRSMAVAISLAVSLFGIGLQATEAARMGFMVLSNVPGSGKSLVAQIGICASFGLPENTPRSGEDELRKVLDTAALQGASYLFFDNLKNYVESPLLEGFMTSPVWAGRVMGSQRGFKAKKSTMLIITGNNLSVSPDLQRRLLQCNLFVKSDIADREHERILTPAYVAQPAVRGELLSALWALVRNWDSQGRPGAGPHPHEKPQMLNSFEEWSKIFGGIVQAAGFANPLEKPAAGKEADVKGMHQRLLVGQLSRDVAERTPLVEFKPQEVIDCIVENEFFTWMVKGRHKKDNGSGEDKFELEASSASTLGLMLTNEMCGREFVLPDGVRVAFDHNGESGRAKRYTVRWVSGAQM